MEVEVHSLAGAGGATLALDDGVFGQPLREDLIHQAVVWFLARARRDTVAHKNRAAVRGGGSKPWRQKGTGRARAGTIRSPLWRGGGKTFVANDRDHRQKLNRKMYRAAMRSILSELVRQERLVVVSDLELPEPRTRALLDKLGALRRGVTLLLVADADDNLYLAARNVPRLEIATVSGIDPVALVGSERVIATERAVQALGELLQ